MKLITYRCMVSPKPAPYDDVPVARKSFGSIFFYWVERKEACRQVCRCSKKKSIDYISYSLKRIRVVTFAQILACHPYSIAR